MKPIAIWSYWVWFVYVCLCGNWYSHTDLCYSHLVNLETILDTFFWFIPLFLFIILPFVVGFAILMEFQLLGWKKKLNLFSLLQYNEILGKGASKIVYGLLLRLPTYPFHNFLNGSFLILFLGDFMCSYRAFDEYEGIEVAWNQVNVPHDVVFNDHDDCDYFSKFLNQLLWLSLCLFRWKTWKLVSHMMLSSMIMISWIYR